MIQVSELSQESLQASLFLSTNIITILILIWTAAGGKGGAS